MQFVNMKNQCYRDARRSFFPDPTWLNQTRPDRISRSLQKVLPVPPAGRPDPCTTLRYLLKQKTKPVSNAAGSLAIMRVNYTPKYVVYLEVSTYALVSECIKSNNVKYNQYAQAQRVYRSTKRACLTELRLTLSDFPSLLWTGRPR